MKKQLYFFVLLGLLSSYSLAQDKYIDLGSLTIPPFETVKYITQSKWIEDKEDGIKTFYQELEKEGFKAHSSRVDSIRVGQNQRHVSLDLTLYHYTLRKKEAWIDIISGSDVDSTEKQWKILVNQLGSWMGSNTRGAAVYLKTKTKKNASINILGRTPHHLMSFGYELPFPILQGHGDLSYEQQLIIKKKALELNRIVNLLAESVVHPDEWMGKPLGNRKMSAAERLYGFTTFWTEVKYNFAFFDQVPQLNWDQVLYDYLPHIQRDQSNEDYYRLMERICAKLGDGHTNVYPPASISYERRSPPIQLKNFENRAFVVNISKDLVSDIPIGSEIIEVDQQPTQQYLETEVFPFISSSTQHILYDWGIRDLLKGAKGSSLEISIRKPDGEKATFSLLRDQNALALEWEREREEWRLSEFKVLENDIAYVSLNSFGNSDIVSDFESYLDSIRMCKGVIIDLRKNGGGSSSNGYDILSHFTKEPFRGSAWRTREHRASFKAWGSFYKDQADTTLDEWQQRAKKTYEGDFWHISEADTIYPEHTSIIELPFIVLIGHQTASAAEDFLVALDQTGLGTTIGQPTFGSTGQPLMISMPGGGSARICTKKDTYPDGREFVGYGIKPNIYIAQTINDFLMERDASLEKALIHLRDKIDAK